MNSDIYNNAAIWNLREKNEYNWLPPEQAYRGEQLGWDIHLWAAHETFELVYWAAAFYTTPYRCLL